MATDFITDELKDIALFTSTFSQIILDRQHFSGQFAKRLFLIGPSATVQDIGLD